MNDSAPLASNPYVPSRGFRDLKMALLLFVFSLTVYLSNGRLISAGDTYPARYLPFAILKHGTLTLDPVFEVASQGCLRPHWILKRDGHAISTYPVVMPLLITPAYLPAAAWLNHHGWTDVRLDHLARLMEKVCAAVLASVTVVLMYFVLRRRGGRGISFFLTVAFAFGTNTWMISSQALWQHGGGQLFLLAALYLLTGTCTEKRALAVGFLCGVTACNRPPDFFLALPLGLYALSWAGNRWWRVVIGALLPLILLLAYHYFVVGEWLGGYALKGDLHSFQYGLFSGLAGMLVSPARGLFVFTPFLLFLIFGIRKPLADARDGRLNLLITGGMVLQLLFYAKLDWRAGCAWGPRWLTDALPLMIWMLVPVLVHARRLFRILFGMTVCFSIGVQGVGAYWYTGKSDEILLAQKGDPGRIPEVWDVRNTPYLLELRHPPAPRGLFFRVDGNIDLVRGEEAVTEVIPIGSGVTVEGWTLTNLQTPERVMVCLGPVWGAPAPIPFPISHVTDFFVRPDVSETMGSSSASGWRVTLRTDGFPPGDHVILVNAKPHSLGEILPVTRRRVKLVRPTEVEASAPIVELEASATVARARLIARQQPEGYWITTYTGTERYQRPRKEMNTFLGAMMIDLLHPVAEAAGLTDALASARTHLIAQIEPNGLTRYHGRPDSPTLAERGRVITPDVDDTALAWRIAGDGGEGLQRQVLEFLEAYRTEEGLYRTWLAPVDEYISIDPGQDPNPADLTIQMHVLMWLDRIDKEAADSLFTAMQGAVDQDEHWVYYRQAPLIPMLRQADLHPLGYPLHLPPSRLHHIAPGQEIWVETCKRLATEEQIPEASLEEARRILVRLAANQFAEIQENPPLLYHNDFSATVGRFYWSEDFGYALWLRLYHKYLHAQAERTPE